MAVRVTAIQCRGLRVSRNALRDILCWCAVRGRSGGPSNGVKPRSIAAADGCYVAVTTKVKATMHKGGAVPVDLIFCKPFGSIWHDLGVLRCCTLWCCHLCRRCNCRKSRLSFSAERPLRWRRETTGRTRLRNKASSAQLPWAPDEYTERQSHSQSSRPGPRKTNLQVGFHNRWCRAKSWRSPFRSAPSLDATSAARRRANTH